MLELAVYIKSTTLFWRKTMSEITVKTNHFSFEKNIYPIISTLPENIYDIVQECDVVLRCNREHGFFFVGLKFDSTIAKAPIVVFKGDEKLLYRFSKIERFRKIPYFDNKPLARDLYTNVEEGDVIPECYYTAAAIVYSHLPQYNNDDSFHEELVNDICVQIYNNIEKYNHNCAEKLYLKTIKSQFLQKTSNANIIKIINQVCLIANNNQMNYKVSTNKSQKNYTVNLELTVEEYGYNFWYIFYIFGAEEIIKVGSRSVFHDFKLNEYNYALEYLKSLINSINEEIPSIKKWCEEFVINKKQYEIVCNSIIAILEKKQKEKNIEIGYNCADKTVVVVYLHYPTDVSEMYKICLTYNEFLRNSKTFEQCIESPKQKTDWNFWMKKQKYHKKYFKKNTTEA